MKLLRSISLALALSTLVILAGFAVHAQAPAPAAAPETAAAPASQAPEPSHYVFAHYMLAYGSSVEFYKHEIALAQRAGIDGFALNAGQWLAGPGKPAGYVTSAENMYEAAKELNTGFRLFFSPDLNGLGDLDLNLADMVSRFKDHPNQMRHEGKVVLSGWAGSPAVYADPIAKIKASGTDVFFVPFVFNSRYSFNWSPETVANFYQGQPHMDGVFFFGADGTFPEIMHTNAVGTRVSHALGKLYMAGISPAFNSPNLRDFHGTQGYDAMWRGIIADQPDWVEIVTWNDYNEDSNLMPFRWPAGAAKDHVSRDEAFLDLTSYYTTWYKTGVQPAFAQDKLYYTYRDRSKFLTKGWDPDKKVWYDITQGVGIVDQIHDDVQDNIYVTTALTAPAELTVTLGASKQTFELPAGTGYATVPMQPGVPHFTLQRKTGKAALTLIDVWGRKLIIDKETEENSARGYHFQNRTFSGAAAAGPATTIGAGSGQLLNGATLVQDGKVTAVRNLEQDGSGVSLPVSNLKSGLYDIRLAYSNPAPTEARLTLYADGPTEGPHENWYEIPAFLPPTGQGRYHTTSFFWSLYENTTFLKLIWVRGVYFGTLTPAYDDKGSVLLQSIELIPVAPVVAPAPRDATVPFMVRVPGGTFQMGSTTGKPDEAPVHAVTLSPFAIAQTEVTNLQFEKFDPSHKALRDEYSWRDGDPVIYVSWNDAMKYCDWLSTQQGLTPAYDEKTSILNAAANGYRLPTEAQWEYEASGRGEGREYPWGNDAPDTTRGNFLLGPTGGDTYPPGYIGSGTVAAGSYPAGASRDGVLDMAGNVSEWLADYYNPYSAAAQTDPVDQNSSDYRAIRGDSWGYYGGDQRVTHREFNNPGYPGYIYIGFRVALPEPNQP